MERDRRSRRIDGFDAARGVAMFLVCFSHFLAVYAGDPGSGWIAQLYRVTLWASPTFVALSGIMFGILTTDGDLRSQRLRIKLADRALFLMFVAHFILLIAPLPSHWSIGWFGPANVTDAIAVAILASVWLVPLVSAPVRATVAVSALALSWTLILTWYPLNAFDVGVKEILFGSLSYRFFPYAWPLVPWAAAYLLATSLGEVLSAQFRQGDRKGGERFVLFVGVAMLGVGLLFRFVSGRFNPHHQLHGAGAALDQLFGHGTKFPPNPSYLLVCGGPGLLILWSALVCARRGWVGGLLREAARVGRCSLVTFLAQAFVYFGILRRLNLSYTPFWPAIFVASVVPLYLFARFWDKRQLNSLLTVGLPGVLDRVRRVDSAFEVRGQ